MADMKRFLERSGMVAVALAGLYLVLLGLTGNAPTMLEKLFNFGIELGNFSLNIRAVVGGLSIYIAGLYAKKFL